MGYRNAGDGGRERGTGAHRSVLFAVGAAAERAGADADAQHGAGEGVQVAVRRGGEVAAGTGVDAGGEHHEEKVYEYEIEMRPVFITLAAGHRLDLQIASEDLSYSNKQRTLDVQLL